MRKPANHHHWRPDRQRAPESRTGPENNWAIREEDQLHRRNDDILSSDRGSRLATGGENSLSGEEGDAFIASILDYI